ncbi:MAG: GFA family protein [Verrucomicrobia bacterium]|nr:GFA family protein [Verrucomicrobiota bacterium]
MSSSPIKLPISGGCYCGNIRYEGTAQPLMMIKCHCRDCQHITGGPYAPAVIFPIAAFNLTKGDLRYHFTNSLAGGTHKRGFCPECGCRITGGQSEENPAPIIGVLAGSLDDPSWFSPSVDFFVSQAEPWDLLSSDTAKFDQYSPG